MERKKATDDGGLEDIIVYQKALEIGRIVWNIVETWNYFHRDVIGKQWIKSADSIAANIAEGYGRYHYNENRLFCYYSRGSLMESKTWLIKAFERHLILEEKYLELQGMLDRLGVLLNRYIHSIGK